VFQVEAHQVAALFDRFVVEIEVDPGGVLRPRPGAPWRREPAAREGTIHRTLAGLAGASPKQIAAAASTHGLLRKAGGRLAALGAEGSERRSLLALGQRLGDDLAAAGAALTAGPAGRLDHEQDDLLAFAAVLAELPEPAHSALELMASGSATPAAIEAAIGDAMPDPADFVATLGRRAGPYLDGTKPLPDPARLIQSLDVLDMSAAFLGGLEETTAALNQSGGPVGMLLGLIANLPEAFLDPALRNERNAAAAHGIELLARETVDDWRAGAAELASWCAATRLVRRATGGRGLSSEEKGSLAEVYRGLAGFEAPATLRAAELGDRVQPLLRTACESLMADLGVWPVPRGAVIGLYGRACVSLWAELTDEPPLVGCATPNCEGSFVLTRNRLYCDECRLRRRREDVRSSRAARLEAPDAD
jgi:hypothetical protein